MTNHPSNAKKFEILDGDLNEEWSNNLKKASKLAIDTEAMGLVHGRDRLCLIQICDEEDQVVCIRIAQEQQSAPRVQALMENQLIEKVFHYARFDVAALASNLGIKVTPIFCTKVASKLARTYSPKHGLKELVMELVGIELDKNAQSSDWGNAEELSLSQLSYAANDVRYLLKIRNQLEVMLRREKRWELANHCFKSINVIAELDRLKFTHIFDH